MAVLELFSTRQKRLRGETPDVYLYDVLPNALRVQIVHLWRESFGTTTEESYGVACPVLSAFREIHELLCKEIGVFSLDDHHNDAFTRVANYFLTCKDVEYALDVIELTFTYLLVMRRGERFGFTAKTTPTDAIDELNQRFKQHGVGYCFEPGIQKLVRIDSQFAHSEVVKPALSILSEKRFRGANEEFAKAHQHYREGRYQESIADCLKAFESTIKVICATQKWNFDANDTSKSLIKVCFERGLIPEYLESQFSAIRALLESGVPTVRNKTSGHGQGTDVRNVPAHLASYALHLTATNIVFLSESEKGLANNV